MDEKEKAGDDPVAQAYVELAESYALISNIEGNPDVNGRKIVKAVRAKFEEDRLDFEKMNRVERERVTRHKLRAAYDYMRIRCTRLKKARARLNEICKTNFPRPSKDDYAALTKALDLYSEAEFEVEVCEIGVDAAEGHVLIRVEQRCDELKSIHKDSAETHAKIERQVSRILQEIELMKKNANPDNWGHL